MEVLASQRGQPDKVMGWSSTCSFYPDPIFSLYIKLQLAYYYNASGDWNVYREGLVLSKTTLHYLHFTGTCSATRRILTASPTTKPIVWILSTRNLYRMTLACELQMYLAFRSVPRKFSAKTCRTRRIVISTIVCMSECNESRTQQWRKGASERFYYIGKRLAKS